MGQVKTYDAKQVSVVVGILPLAGFDEGGFVTIERDDDAYVKQVGADGEVTRSKSNNKTGKVTITLQAASKSNDYLTGLEKSGAIVPVLVRDSLGSTLAFSQQGWVQKLPSVEFGKESGTRQWIIDCGDLDVAVGGN